MKGPDKKVESILEERLEEAQTKLKKYFGVELTLRKDAGEVSEENLKSAEGKINLVEFDKKGNKRSRKDRRKVIKIMLTNGNN